MFRTFNSSTSLLGEDLEGLLASPCGGIGERHSSLLYEFYRISHDNLSSGFISQLNFNRVS
jgi:hypothetical protein